MSLDIAAGISTALNILTIQFFFIQSEKSYRLQLMYSLCSQRITIFTLCGFVLVLDVLFWVFQQFDCHFLLQIVKQNISFFIPPHSTDTQSHLKSIFTFSFFSSIFGTDVKTLSVSLLILIARLPSEAPCKKKIPCIILKSHHMDNVLVSDV